MENVSELMVSRKQREGMLLPPGSPLFPFNFTRTAAYRVVSGYTCLTLLILSGDIPKDTHRYSLLIS